MGVAVMDDNEDEVYKLIHEDSPTLCSRICSCLYKYTVGSCLYHNNDDETDSDPLIKPDRYEELTSIHQITGESAQKESDIEWQKKTFLKIKADCKMKKRIRYHFDDHVKRWINRQDRRRFPWKLTLHLVLVALVTTQVNCY